jgi:3-oxoacyl-[acyl-carrier protein] reductase
MSKVVFITGGTTGIGRSIACTLAKDGFDVCINCRKDPSEFEELKKEIEKNNVKCYFARGDVSNYDDAERMIKDIIEKFEKIDVLVNNAGITKDNLLMRMKKEDFEDVINVNLVGTFNITKCAVPYMMKKRSGRIINMSSVVRNFWKCRAS